jgi:hypothetical protein
MRLQHGPFLYIGLSLAAYGWSFLLVECYLFLYRPKSAFIFSFTKLVISFCMNYLHWLYNFLLSVVIYLLAFYYYSTSMVFSSFDHFEWTHKVFTSYLKSFLFWLLGLFRGFGLLGPRFQIRKVVPIFRGSSWCKNKVRFAFITLLKSPILLAADNFHAGTGN